MSILRIENAVPLGQGVQARLADSGAGMAGSVTNRTPYDLEDCYVASGGRSVRPSRSAMTTSVAPTMALPSSNSR